MDKDPGDWYGVNSIGQVVQSIFKKHQEVKSSSEIFSKMSFLAFQDGNIYLSEIIEEVNKSYEDNVNSNKFRPLSRSSYDMTRN